MKRLIEQLRESGYLQFYLFFGEMNLRYKDWAAASPSTSGSLKSLISLFLLGESTSEKAAGDLIGEEAVERLRSAGVLVGESGSVRSNSFYLLVHRGLFYFCQMTADPFAYVGEDSLALSHYQTPLQGSRVLDLCAGPGLQSLVAAQRGNQVTAVEQNEQACKVHRINLEINGLADRVEIVAMTAQKFADATGDRFQQILFNPPLVPMPSTGQGFPVAGYGGREGLDLTAVILRDYRPRLEASGHFEFVGMTVAPQKATHPVIKVAKRLRLRGRIHLLSRHRLSGNAVVMEMHAASLARAKSMSAPTARREIEEKYRGCDHFSLFFGRLQRASARDARLETIDMSTSHYGGWFS